MNRTRNKVLSMLLMLCMVISLLPTVALATPAETDVAAIGETGYATLAAAVSAAQDNDTIKLLANITGDGVIVPEGKRFTLDFNGKTYTVNANYAGSEGTKTQCFQLLKNSTLTFKNGTIDVGASGLGMVIQNYANLTLDNMILDGSALNGAAWYYTLSNNCGTVIVKDTNIIAKTGEFALDSCKFSTYDAPTVTISGSSEINGKMEVTGGTLVVEGGSFTDIATAVKYAANNASVKLGANVTIDTMLTLDKSITLDLNGHNITRTSPSGDVDAALVVKGGASIAVTGTGSIISNDSTNHKGTPITINPDGTKNVADNSYAVSTVTLGSGVTVTGGYAGAYIYDNGKLVVNGATVEGYWYGVVPREAGAVIEVSSGAVKGTATTLASGEEAIGISGNGSGGVNSSTITISGGTVSGKTAGIYHPQPGTLTINGGTIEGDTALEMKAGTAIISDAAVLTATSGVAGSSNNNNGLSTVGYAVAVVENANYGGSSNSISVSITGGKLTGAIAKLRDTEHAGNTYSLAVSGGYFAHDPSAYLAEGKIAQQKIQTIGGIVYNYEVVTKLAEVEVAPAAPAIDEPEAGTPEYGVYEVLNTAPPTVSGLEGAAGAAANAEETTAAVGAEALAEALSTAVEASAVTIYVQPYLDIEITDAKAESGTVTELTLEITPMVKTVASTASDAGTIDLDGEVQNAVQIGDARELDIDTPVTITIPLPTGFVTTGLKIKHIKENGSIYFYEPTISEGTPKTATFTVTHGFSTFVAASDTRSVQVAFDYNTATGETKTYTALNVGQALPADTRSGYTFNGWTFEGVSGTYKTLTDALLTALYSVYTDTAIAATPSWSYNGGSVTSYTLTFETNGGSAISAVTKSGGTSIDLSTYKPTKSGYDFDGWYSDEALTEKITSVKLTKNTAVYAKWTESAVNPFSDVKADSYFYDAVIWAVANEITDGKTADTFAPNETCTRAQTVTFLWRAMGSPEPTTTACQFTDVKADAYYYKAVLWAVEKGITNGTTDTTFSPDATVTRGQVVTFQWRAAGSKAVTTANPFTDVAAGDYCTDAVLWAVSEKITDGTTATTFSPNDPCTRAQIVTFLFRQLGN